MFPLLIITNCWKMGSDLNIADTPKKYIYIQFNLIFMTGVNISTTNFVVGTLPSLSLFLD